MRAIRFLERLLPLLVIAGIASAGLFVKSCANTTTPPSGGLKDTIPPVMLLVEPQNMATYVPRNKGSIKMTFDEYVVVKTSQDIFLSPPMDKPPKYKIRGKSVVVSFDGILDSNRTYVLDMGQSIADNNEGNIYPGFVIAFSTGGTVDSMYLTGMVMDYSSLEPFKGATVALYTSMEDSVMFKERPVAASKTDDWGFFAIRNIKDTLYRMIAFNDINNDSKFNAESEEVAFLDTLVRPRYVVADNVLELLKLDMKDTLACNTRKAEYKLRIFKEATSRQYLVNKARTGEKSCYITFSSPYVQIDSMWFEGIPTSKIITYENEVRDSIIIWINDANKLQPDSLWLNVNYMKTDDSLKIRVPVTERVALHKTRKMIQESMRYKPRNEMKAEDTATVYKVTVSGDNVDQEGFVIDFTYPLVEAHFDSLKLLYLNARKQEFEGKFKVIHDTSDVRRYRVFPDLKLEKGFEYTLKIPHGAFFDINRMPNDSSKTSFSLPNDDNLSTILLVLNDVDSRFLIELVNEKRDKVLRKYLITTDTTLVFPYIAEGRYSIRMTEDKNGNGIVDVGSLLEKKQPEKVKFYELSDGTNLISVMPGTEIEQEVSLRELFKN